MNWNRAFKQLIIWLMMITVSVLGLTTILFEAFEMLELDELDEIHEFCGFTFFGLIIIHLILHRKGLFNLLTFKTK